MKSIFKMLIPFFLIACVLLSSCAYSSEIVPCYDIICALTSLEISLPAGKTYSHDATEGEDEYISESLLCALFAEGGDIPLLESWIDYALFLPSSNHPCEFIVILCDTPSSAKDTARLLCRRLNTIKSVKKESEHAEYDVYLDNAEVIISRNYVLLIISSDSTAAKKKALSMIG